MATKVRYAAGLDVGSSFVRCLVGVIENQRLRFLGAGDCHSRGWLRGRMVDQDQVAESIRTAVHEAELQAHLPIESVVVGMGGSTIEGVNSRGRFKIGKSRELQTEDLRYAMEVATRLKIPEDRMLLQVCPQEFVVDGHGGQRNPRGLTCSTLEALAHLVTVPTHDHESLISAVHMAHLGVEETVYEPLAAAYACLMPHDRNRGVALLDVGLHSAGLVVYDGDSLVHSCSLPVWGDHFTNDVAKVMTLSYEDAERLKCDFGCAVIGLTADNTYIEIPGPDSRTPREISRRLLNDILEARCEELFALVRMELRRVNMDQKLLEGIVLTGGGSDMQGFATAAERVTNMRARIGHPIVIEHWPDDLPAAQWSTAAGLCMYAGRLRLRQDKPRKGMNWFGFGER